MKILIFLILFLNFTLIQAKENYFIYFKLVNEAEEAFVIKENPQEGIKLYDKAFASVKMPFPKDCFIASQFAYYAGDTTKFLDYLSLAFDRGVPIECLKNPKVFSTILLNKALMSRVERIYSKREPLNVNESVRDSIYLRFYHAQTIKRSVGRDMNKMKQFDELENQNFKFNMKVLGVGKFPSSQEIGIETDSSWVAFLRKYNLKPLDDLSLIGFKLELIPVSYSLDNQKSYVCIHHMPCLFDEYKAALWKSVENGYLTPKHYGYFEELYALGAPNWWKGDWYCQVNRLPIYYGILEEFRFTEPEKLKEIEKRRAAKYMQKWSVDKVKLQWETEKGFDFFFGHGDKI